MVNDEVRKCERSRKEKAKDGKNVKDERRIRWKTKKKVRVGGRKW